MHEVAYRETGFPEIELIRHLWEQLNRYHCARASVFRSHYEQMTFDNRKDHFRNLHEKGVLRLDLAIDTMTGNCIGYCVSSLSVESHEKIGEIESLFVSGPFRSEGIGTALMTRAIEWLDMGGAVRKRLSVADGNEAAVAFYRKFGFFPRMMVLEQKPDG